MMHVVVGRVSDDDKYDPMAQARGVVKLYRV